MGREVKRVPLDFDWPIGKVWSGYVMPSELNPETCWSCEGDGMSPAARAIHNQWYGYTPFDPLAEGGSLLTSKTPAVRAFAERNVAGHPQYYGEGEQAIEKEATRLAELWNGQLSHHLVQEDVEALIAESRLTEFTHRVEPEKGWVPLDPVPAVTAEQVNDWSIRSGLGHDSINCWVVVKARCDRAGQDPTCSTCGGSGSLEVYPGQMDEMEAWSYTEPPEGEGWQLWDTTGDGSPMTPVFHTPGDLATYCVEEEVSWFGYETASWGKWLRSFEGEGITGMVELGNGAFVM